MKKIAILGSTGSIGTQALQVIKNNRDKFEATVLTANENAGLLIKQAVEFLPDSVVIANKEKYNQVADGLKQYPVKVYAGEDSIAQVTSLGNIDIVLTALVGFSGLIPTITAIGSGKEIAIANKKPWSLQGS